MEQEELVDELAQPEGPLVSRKRQSLDSDSSLPRKLKLSTSGRLVSTVSGRNPFVEHYAAGGYSDEEEEESEEEDEESEESEEDEESDYGTDESIIIASDCEPIEISSSSDEGESESIGSRDSTDEESDDSTDSFVVSDTDEAALKARSEEKEEDLSGGEQDAEDAACVYQRWQDRSKAFKQELYNQLRALRKKYQATNTLL